MDQELLGQLSEGIVFAQAKALASEFIVMEIVGALARGTSDPQGFIGDLSRRVNVRVEHFPIGQDEPLGVELRHSIRDFFSRVKEQLPACGR